MMGWHRKRIHILVDVWLHRKRHVNFLGGTAKKKRNKLMKKKIISSKFQNASHIHLHIHREHPYLLCIEQYRKIQQESKQNRYESVFI